MGLDITHDAFSGAYSAFNRFRQCICEAMGDGSSYPPHYIYGPGGAVGGKFPTQHKPGYDPDFLYTGDSYTRESHPGLWEFLTHSDCDGEISPELCVHVADELEALLPKIEALGWDQQSGGHIAARGGYVECTRKFIAGCRAAADEGVPLEFY